MRTTLTIDDSLMAELKDIAHRESVPLKQVINRVLRQGLDARQSPRRRRRYRCPTHAMGQPTVGSLDKALDIAAALEDEELARKLAVGK